MRSALAPQVKLHEVWAWSMYDFANSGYTTVVITAVFGAYFVSEVAQNAPWATFAWTAALSVSYAAILVTGPLIGAWADAYAAKKQLLLLSTIGCVAFTALLWLAAPGAIWLALGLIVLSNYFFGSGENLIAAFLPELADSQAMGRVSGWGWSFGYLGGLASLGICLAYIAAAQRSGQPAALFVPVTMLITAGFFAVAATPTFLFLRERAVPQPATENAWKRVRDTLRHAREYRDLRRFLLCMLFYQAGISAVVALAAVARRRVLRAVGAFGQGGVDLRTADIRRGDLELRRQPSPRHPGDGRLLRHRPRASRRHRRAARPQGGYRYTSAHLMISMLVGSSRQCLASSCQRRCLLTAIFFAAGFAAGLAASFDTGVGAGFNSGAWRQAGAASASASSRTVGFIRLPLSGSGLGMKGYP